MSLITLKITYGPVIGDGNFQPTAVYSGIAFDTDSKQVVSISGTWRGALLEPKPADYWAPDQSIVHFDCDGFNCTRWAYFRINDTVNAGAPALLPGYCGYELPQACNLTLTYSADEDEATIVPGPGTFIGPLRYSKNGGSTWQASNKFTGLPLGDTVVQVQDLGVTTPSCVVSITVTIDGTSGGGGGEEPEDPEFLPPSTLAPEALDLVQQPCWLSFTGYTPGQLVQLELLVETTAHRAGTYELLIRSVKVADRAGLVYFRVDAQLRSRLRITAPTGLGAYQFDTDAVRNYYAITSLVSGRTGLASSPTAHELRTALLAAVPVEADFLTAQPATKNIEFPEPEYLYYLVPKVAPTNIRLVRQYTQKAGNVAGGLGLSTTSTDAEVILIEDGQGPAGYRLLCLPVYGPRFSGADCTRVTVQLLTIDGAQLTPARTYDLVPRVQETKRVFLFHTPQGGVDTLVTLGRGTAKLSTAGTVSERGRLPSDTRASAQQQVYQLDERRQFKIGVGWQTRPQLVWLQGFVLSRHVWFQRKGALLPILPTKREIVYENDDKRLEGLTFEFELASDLAAVAEL